MAVYLGQYQVSLGGLTDLSGASIVNNQNKTVNPSTSQQTVTFDSGYTGLGTVTITAMPGLTLPTSTSGSATSGYSSKATIGRSTSDQYINIGTGYNAAGAYYKISAVPNGTAGTPTATKGTVSNYSITVTPSVTNTAGYISSETKTGTAVTVTASELVSGSETKTSNGTYDVTNLAELVVNVTSSSPTIQSLSITPSTSEQTFNASSVDGYKPVTVAAMPAITLPTAVSTTSSGTSKATLTLTGGTRYLNIPTGYNSTAQYYTLSVANGSATGPSSLSGTSATVSTGTNTLTLTKTGVTTTPTVSAGYVSSATASTATVTLTASVTTKAATTYHPSTTAQSISSGTYLTGAQTIAAVTTSNLSASNIVSGVTIKVGDSSDDDCVASVTGNVVLQNYYTGSSAPSSATGSNGDLYLQS